MGGDRQVPPAVGELSLEPVGLAPVAAAAYRIVVRRREVSRDVLSEQLGLPVAAVEVVVAQLVAAELVTETAEDPPRLVAAPPDVAGEVLLLRRMQELQQVRREFARLADEYRIALTTDPVGKLIEVVSRDAVPRLNDQLNNQAQDEVMWVNAPPYVAPAASYVREAERLAVGIRYRCIYARAELDQPGALEMIRRDIDAGEQARVIDTVPLKVGIVDRRVALVPLYTGADDPADKWVLVHRCSLLDALIALFETMWLSALPLDGLVAPPGANDLASEDLRVLSLLLAGMTDEAIARQLGIGRRTVTRRVRQLMDRAGVSTRMQLGWKASQLGWLAAGG